MDYLVSEKLVRCQKQGFEVNKKTNAIDIKKMHSNFKAWLENKFVKEIRLLCS